MPTNQAPNTTGSNHLYNTLELLMMGIMLPETCWASNKICNKNHLLHLVGILFPHINDDARSKPHQRKSKIGKVGIRKLWDTIGSLHPEPFSDCIQMVSQVLFSLAAVDKLWNMIANMGVCYFYYYIPLIIFISHLRFVSVFKQLIITSNLQPVEMFGNGTVTNNVLVHSLQVF